MKNVQQALAAALGLDRFGFYFVQNEIEIPETCGAQQICDDSRLAIRVLVWLPAEDVVDGSKWGWGWSPLWSWIGIAGMDRGSMDGGLQAMETPFAAVVLSLLTQLHNLRHLFIDLDI